MNKPNCYKELDSILYFLSSYFFKYIIDIMTGALSRLDISQLKNSYQIFEGLSEHVKFYDHHYFSYHLFKGRDGSHRLLFYPVTLHEASEPSACDLFSLLVFVRNDVTIASLSIDQIIIPVGEKSAFGLVNHMITLVIHFYPTPHSHMRPLYNVINNSLRESICEAKPPANARLIDSLGFSIPGCHQTNDIYNVLKVFYLVMNFDREYLSHQSQLDNESCCYFTVKTIEQLLQMPLDILMLDYVPKPNTWFSTSKNWLTPSYRLKIKETILSAFAQYDLDDTTIQKINDSIIEVD